MNSVEQFYHGKISEVEDGTRGFVPLWAIFYSTEHDKYLICSEFSLGKKMGGTLCIELIKVNNSVYIHEDELNGMEFDENPYYPNSEYWPIIFYRFKKVNVEPPKKVKFSKNKVDIIEL